MHNIASGPELQAVRFGFVILGEKKRKAMILEDIIAVSPFQ
jgi:hypothetical protein